MVLGNDQVSIRTEDNKQRGVPTIKLCRLVHQLLSPCSQLLEHLDTYIPVAIANKSIVTISNKLREVFRLADGVRWRLEIERPIESLVGKPNLHRNLSQCGDHS
jgi:hypothetical protein